MGSLAIQQLSSWQVDSPSVFLLFSIDSANEMRYNPFAPQGVSGKGSLKTKQLAVGNWQLAKTKPLKPTPIWDGLGWHRTNPLES